jgi:transcriptional regulator with XRE-family HTH domain
MLWLNDLQQRKQELGLSNAAISRRSGVSISTVERVFAGRGEGVSIGRIQKIAEALEAEVRSIPTADAGDVLDQRARRIAQGIVSSVQGSMGLEAQAVSKSQLRRMVEQTIHELRAGPKRVLWEND